MFIDGFVLFLVFTALLVDIIGAIYLLRIAHRSPGWVQRLIEEWRSGNLLDNLVKKDEEGEIIMDERLVAVVDLVGARMFQGAKMSALQGLSVNSKLEKGLKGAFAKDILEQKLPIIDLLGDFMGFNVKQYVAKNPDALMQLLQMPQVQGLLGQVMGQGSRTPHNSPGQVPVM